MDQRLQSTSRCGLARGVPFLLTCALAAGAGSSAQTLVHSGPYASSGGGAYKNVVRDAGGDLLCLLVSEDTQGNRPLLLRRSTDGGSSWVDEPVVLNDASSGMNPPDPTGNSAIAIDDRGILHVLWGNYVYPSNYRQYYRNYDPASGGLSPIIDITAMLGASTTARTAAMDITVDAGGTVWMVGHGPSSWTERLVKSDLPYAAGFTFTDLGNISESASAQNARLCVDVLGRIHCSYYRNQSPGLYEHRIYDPASGWGSGFVLGNSSPENDYYGGLAADFLGNVHALYAVDSSSSSALWNFRYRRWDAASGWGPETLLFSATAAQHTGIANYKIFALACDEATGDAYAVYRDLASGGSLRMAQKGLADSAFINMPDLAPPNAGQHAYYVPTLRGTLFPLFNNTGQDLDVTWQYRASPGNPPYALFFQRVAGSARVSITLGGPAVIGTTTSVNLFSALDPSGTYICGFSGANSPGIPLPDGRVIPLRVDLILVGSLNQSNQIFLNTLGILDSAGGGTVLFVVPGDPTLVGATVHAAFIVIDPSTGVIGSLSPGLPIQIQ